MQYACSDLTATPYPEGSFGAITCLSVIEHGVPLDAMAAEVDRLLKPGGVFLFTTDFDGTGQSHTIDPKFQVFGQSWTIFDPETLEGVIDRFRNRGFTLLGPTSAMKLTSMPDLMEWRRLHFRAGRAPQARPESPVHDQARLS